ncbi:hypothetical protein LCGC14_0822770 [marine sediment metagenome]|uniref:Ankyrin repeat domain-containing protein n=2 Tax=root TaxID=1 RepID=A0A831QPJ6_9FLAO|nr:ankyrin repeat domain-containing protein [Pricia sp.]HEA20697.1 ankyrin repeat domain-containing protein [Pricia antarctica]
MRKTVVTAAAVCLLAVSGLSAMDITNDMKVPSLHWGIENVDISSFCKAIVKGDFETVKSLIELGEDVNQKTLGMTPAMFAARYNRVDILELLIEHGANLKMRSDCGFSVKKYAELSNATDALLILDTTVGS